MLITYCSKQIRTLAQKTADKLGKFADRDPKNKIRCQYLCLYLYSTIRIEMYVAI
jgi:hypothetical protein